MNAMAAGRQTQQAGAVGVETTTRHACAAPGRLGSIRARPVRRPLGGNGSLPFDPDRTRLPRLPACPHVPL